MGYMRHHVIIVTSWKKELLEKAHKNARRIFPDVSEVFMSKINCYVSFFVPPDGSKEGWEESDLGDRRRNIFIEWIDRQRYEDGGSALDWAEVQYGDDNGVSKVVRHDDD